MKEVINQILALDIPSTNKLILIYFVTNGAGCISQVDLSKNIGCSPSGLNKCLTQLQENGYLKIDSKTYKQSYYKVLLEKNIMHDYEECTECGKSIVFGEDIYYVSSSNGVFCDNKCHARYILDDLQFKELYPED